MRYPKPKTYFIEVDHYLSDEEHDRMLHEWGMRNRRMGFKDELILLDGGMRLANPGSVWKAFVGGFLVAAMAALVFAVVMAAVEAEGAMLRNPFESNEDAENEGNLPGQIQVIQDWKGDDLTCIPWEVACVEDGGEKLLCIIPCGDVRADPGDLLVCPDGRQYIADP